MKNKQEQKQENKEQALSGYEVRRQEEIKENIAKRLYKYIIMGKVISADFHQQSPS